MPNPFPPGFFTNKRRIELYPPELRAAMVRDAVSLDSETEWATVGLVRLPGLGWLGGVLALATNELAAYRIRAAFRAFGDADVARTERHPDGPTFNVAEVLAMDVTLHDSRGRRWAPSIRFEVRAHGLGGTGRTQDECESLHGAMVDEAPLWLRQ